MRESDQVASVVQPLYVPGNVPGVIPTLNARDILYMSRYDTWCLPDGCYNVLYEDGIMIETTKRGIIYDRCIWELYLLYPETPIISTNTYKGVLDEGVVFADMMHTYLDRMIKYLCEFNQLRTYESKTGKYVSGPVDRTYSIEGTFTKRYVYPQDFANLPVTSRPLLERVFIVENIIYNEVVLGASPNVVSTDILDFIDIVNNPVVKEIHAQFEPTPDSVDKSYTEINKWVYETKIDNPVIDSVVAGAVRIAQFNQCIGPRGFVADLNRLVFAYPIQEGYVQGIPTLRGLMSESRTAAKALNAAGDSIRKSEYASRRFQLLTMSVERYVEGDCGTQSYLDVVMSDRYLKNFIGKWYLDEKEDVLKDIKGDEVHLIGTTIKVRTIFGCMLPNRHHVCSRCLGRVTENFRETINLGEKMSQYFMMGVTQGVLSTKHHVRSVSSSGLSLAFDGGAYFRGDELSQLYLHDDPKLLKNAIILNGKDLYKLVDVLSVNEVDIPMAEIGGIETVGFRNPDGINFDVVTLASPDMPASLTRDFLEHIKRSEFEINSDGNYVVPLVDWDVKSAIFEVPLKEPDNNSYVTLIEKNVEGTVEKRLPLKEHFFRLVNLVLERSNCNIAVLEVITYAISAFNLQDGNMRLGRGSPDMQYGKREDIFNSRSISQFLIFEVQMRNTRTKPHIVLGTTNRQRHPADVLLKPQEVVNAYHKELIEIEKEKERIAM